MKHTFEQHTSKTAYMIKRWINQDPVLAKLCSSVTDGNICQCFMHLTKINKYRLAEKADCVCSYVHS